VIRYANSDDAKAICAIYDHYAKNTIVTFADQALPVYMLRNRFSTATIKYPVLVCEQDRWIVGYTMVRPWKSRPAYRYSAEVGIYLDPEAVGRGLGSQLYRELLRLIQGSGLHSLIAGIALPNAASVVFHEKFGFQFVGRFEDVGYKFGRWIDVGYWQLVLGKQGGR